MKISWLQSFVAVADNKSFSQAADELFSTQSNVSKHIKLLEDELGVRLFTRHNRSFDITPEGAALLLYAQEAINANNRLLEAAGRLKKPLLTRFRIASVPITHIYDIHQFIKDFHIRHPDLELEIAECDMNSLQYELKNSPATICILRKCCLKMLPQDSVWKYVPFCDDELVVVCSKNHPYSERESVPLAECLNHRLVVLNSGKTEYQMTLNRLSAEPIDLQTHLYLSSFFAIKDYVKRDYGISIISRKLAKLICGDNGVIWRPLDERPQFSLVIAVREPLYSKEIRLIIKEIVDSVNSGSGPLVQNLNL